MTPDEENERLDEAEEMNRFATAYLVNVLPSDRGVRQWYLSGGS
jgi:hypothetical protein